MTKKCPPKNEKAIEDMGNVETQIEDKKEERKIVKTLTEWPHN